MPHYINGKEIQVVGNDVDNIAALVKPVVKEEVKKEAPKVSASIVKPKKSTTKKKGK
jgi:hypothetical protein